MHQTNQRFRNPVTTTPTKTNGVCYCEMSLVRVNRPLYGVGKRPVRTKKSAPKKEWVDTVNDLSLHKATPEELARRHEMHRSQNKVVAQWELREKALARRRRKNHPSSPAGLDRARLNIIRELGPHRPSPTGASVSREHSAERLSSTNSVVRQVLPSTDSELQHTQQSVCVERSSRMEIEQKLQELNRQSAEARARLLELIEQQKQSISPAISPVPPHSSSTHTFVRGITPEQFVTLPERSHSPQSSASSRRSAGRASPQSLDSVEIQSIENQVEKLKREGWFALSSHIK
ncbi:spindle and centriole-associated protein [Pimephales promelas]|nr:spindle and centriole-associated protein [Pimephales promelas]